MMNLRQALIGAASLIALTVPAVAAETVKIAFIDPLSGGAANATVNLIAPGSVNFDRYTQIDLRVGKSIRVSTYRTSVNLDIFNALNEDPVLSLNNTFGGATPWLTPQSIMQGRLLKISAQFDF